MLAFSPLLYMYVDAHIHVLYGGLFMLAAQPIFHKTNTIGPVKMSYIGTSIHVCIWRCLVYRG